MTMYTISVDLQARLVALSALATLSTGRLWIEQADDPIPQASVLVKWSPPDGLVATKEFVFSRKRRVKGLTLVVEGRRATEERDEHSELVETVRFEDNYSKVEDPRQLVVRREYVALSRNGEQFGKDQSATFVGDSPLLGKAVLFTIEPGGRLSSAFENGPSDDPLLKRLLPWTDMECLLPSGPVHVGDEWGVDFDQYRFGVMRAGGDLSWEMTPSMGNSQLLQDQLWSKCAGEITATLSEQSNTDGRDVVTIDVAGDIDADIDLTEFARESLPERLVVHYEMTGTLRWNVEIGMPVDLTVTMSGPCVEYHWRATGGQAVQAELEYSDTVTFTAAFSYKE
jgi:hypothetical protein